jgi:hypothetical protein
MRHVLTKFEVLAAPPFECFQSSFAFSGKQNLARSVEIDDKIRLRFQPQSALSTWFRERYGSGGKRLRRIGIVAVARKLLIALWRFLETGVLPESAILKEG